MAREKIPPELRNELLSNGKKKGIITADNHPLLLGIKERWNKLTRYRRQGRPCPSDITLTKFFTEDKNHDTWVINGLCWIILGYSYSEWTKQYGGQPQLFSFSPNTLSGLWLSQYSYRGRTATGETFENLQISLEFLSSGRGKVKGENVFGASNVPVIHSYTFHGTIHPRHFIAGIWTSRNGDHVGSFLLFVYPNRVVMSGKHLGNAEDNAIEEGPWTWIKVNVSSTTETVNPEDLRKHLLLNDFDTLAGIFNDALSTRSEIELSDITHNI
jgi:hypothetical protein